jgi:Ca2+-binding RTX toxin-like protein
MTATVAINEATAFLINSATGGVMTHQHSTALVDGRIAVIWQETTGQNGDASGSAIKGEILNANGSVFAAEFLINTSTLGDQILPTIAALASGGFVVAWQDGSLSASPRGQDIRAQIFALDGNKTGSELLVNSLTAGDQTAPVITSLTNGNFAVAWNSTASPTPAEFAVFSATGTPVSSETNISIHPSSILGTGPLVVGILESAPNNITVFNIQNTWSASSINWALYGDNFDATGAVIGSGNNLLGGNYRYAGNGAWDFASNATFGSIIAYQLTAGNFPGYQYNRAIVVQSFDQAGVAATLATIDVATDPTLQYSTVSNITISAGHGSDIVLAYTDTLGFHLGTVNGGAFHPVILENSTLPVGASEFDITDLSQGRFLLSWTAADGSVTGQFFDYLGDGAVQDGTASMDVLVGTTGRDILRGFDGNDILVGGGGLDAIYGGTGDDVIVSGTGAAFLYGEAGNDTFFISDGTTHVTELAGEGYDTIHSSVNFILPVNVEALFLTDSAQYATGNADTNLIVGNDKDNIIDGGLGNDLLYGGNGDDVIYGGEGDNQLFGQAGNDWLTGLSGADIMLGGDGNDVLLGYGGNDTLYGEAGNDTLVGDDGNDTLYGGIGQDALYGNAGNDLLFGEAGNDNLYAGTGDDTIFGGDGADWLWGEAGNDTLLGSIGDDVLLGQDGNDFLVFDEGTDSGYGGSGADIFYWSSPTQGADVVSDFSHAEGDKIYLDHTSFGVAAGLTLTEGSNFFSGAGATSHSAVATFYFDTTSNIFWYDADGTGAGGANAITFLANGGGGLAAWDILLV